MENHSTNFASDAETAQIAQPDLPLCDAVRPVVAISNVSSARPLWLSTPGYFFIALAISLGLFFLTWGLLHDESESETSWIPAAIAAALLMSLAVAAREVIFLRAQTRYLLLNDKFGSSITPTIKAKTKTNKFTLEQNKAALRLIQSKVDEANSILATTEKHLEVFKASQEYLEIVERELQKVQAGSPRLPALRNGQDAVKMLHKHHLLRWAAEKSNRMMREATFLVLANEKIEAAHRAIETLEFALKFYPDEPQLVDSSVAVQEFTTLIRVTHWIELAERSAFKGHYRRAIDHYQDALFYLTRQSLNSQEINLMSLKIEGEIERLNVKLSGKKTIRKKLSQKK
ncbi:MAG: hypothetical protein ABI954_03635 [Pyrinomonadaceae bacterium]